jgi:hypothetical protein
MTGSGGSSSVLKTFMPDVYESTLENFVEVEHAVLFATATSVCCNATGERAISTDEHAIATTRVSHCNNGREKVSLTRMTHHEHVEIDSARGLSPRLNFRLRNMRNMQKMRNMPNGHDFCERSKKESHNCGQHAAGKKTRIAKAHLGHHRSALSQR